MKDFVKIKERISNKLVGWKARVHNIVNTLQIPQSNCIGLYSGCRTLSIKELGGFVKKMKELAAN